VDEVKDGSRSDGWARGCVNLRLTQERARKLRSIAMKLGPAATPTEAVDLALDIALTGKLDAEEEKDAAADDSARLASALERLSSRTRSEAEAHSAALADVARGVRGLAELISAVAATSGASHDGFDEPQSLSSWLDAQARRTPGQPVTARARWQSKTRTGDHHVALELLVTRVPAGDGRFPQTGASSTVRLDRIEVASPFARTDLISAFLLSCQRTADGSWQIAGFQIKPDGGPGPLLGSIKA